MSTSPSRSPEMPPCADIEAFASRTLDFGVINGLFAQVDPDNILGMRDNCPSFVKIQTVVGTGKTAREAVLRIGQILIHDRHTTLDEVLDRISELKRQTSA